MVMMVRGELRPESTPPPLANFFSPLELKVFSLLLKFPWSSSKMKRGRRKESGGLGVVLSNEDMMGYKVMDGLDLMGLDKSDGTWLIKRREHR